MENRVHIPMGQFLTVWAALLVLTGVTVTVAGLRLGAFSVFTAILIAAAKASLVLLFFMRLKYEPLLFRAMLLAAVATIAVIMALTFADVAFR
jgi:cytochrome c oxidase subunit 4